MRFKPKPFTKPVKFKCKFCLDCCKGRHVYLTLKDIKRLIDAGKDPQEFLTISIEGNKIRFVLSVREWDLGCVFQDPETGLCTVHPHRPLICRIYPFMVSKKPLGVEGEKPIETKDGRFWLYYDENCPGINNKEGEEITPEQILKLGIEFERELEETTIDNVLDIL
ncbi:YkgJ family cysteine cluster protein [Pyrococcus abyssi]|uniref:YkgJ family cysteine cluster protein n=1 Tax=Pyrococcus abyssi (strain GE5 / Orsay) TaxID=272844 RepID=Q9V1J6_PYRAB|nr:YkgJ family cysteine cluster protein [Pyrococcus abyssi]CAB49353.1 Hypothetical protein, containing a putative zinc binding site [Pyrococcus abyssi GE5]CCE69812.1 TPA: hypothetical protein PAB2060 [Pyrococcus abyssi GE5]